MRQYRGRLLLVALLMVGGMALDARINAIIENPPILAAHKSAPRSSDSTLEMFSGFDLEGQAAARAEQKRQAERLERITAVKLVATGVGVIALAMCGVAAGIWLYARRGPLPHRPARYEPPAYDLYMGWDR